MQPEGGSKTQSYHDFKKTSEAVPYRPRLNLKKLNAVCASLCHTFPEGAGIIATSHVSDSCINESGAFYPISPSRRMGRERFKGRDAVQPLSRITHDSTSVRRVSDALVHDRFPDRDVGAFRLLRHGCISRACPDRQNPVRPFPWRP